MGRTRRHRDRVAAIRHRCDFLHERLSAWDRGDPDRTRAELSALRWALRLIDACEREGVLDDLRARGHDV